MGVSEADAVGSTLWVLLGVGDNVVAAVGVSCVTEALDVAVDVSDSVLDIGNE